MIFLAENWKVKSGALLKSSAENSTSKIQQFKPAVSLKEAIQWICENGDVLGIPL